MSDKPVASTTPRTDKLFDMVADREQPDGGRWGDTPNKWSYEAVLDLTDFARQLERELAQAEAKASYFEKRFHEDDSEATNLLVERAEKAEAALAKKDAEVARLLEALEEIKTHSVCCDARHVAFVAIDAAKEKWK